MLPLSTIAATAFRCRRLSLFGSTV
jgi:hypothetical protein